MNLHGITHIFNEALLLPWWVLHHRGVFDSMLVINYGSTDNSMEIVREMAPGWTIVDSELLEFDASKLDAQVMAVERTLPTGPDEFKLVLNTTEFMWDSNFRKNLELDHYCYPETQAFGLKSFCLVDGENELDFPVYYEEPLWLNHTHGKLDSAFPGAVPRHSRFVHNGNDGRYGLGRHHTELPHRDMEGSYLLHATFAPWPQAVERKLQIQTKMSQHDKTNGFGIQHQQTPESLDVTYRNWLDHSYSLFENEDYRRIYDEYCAQHV
jgi:hypothetical protein